MSKISNKYKRLFTLNEPNAPRLNPALASEIGLNESIILLQIEFWISISEHVYDGRRWTYQSLRDMQQKAFPFWSIATINRAINNLIEQGYIIEGNYNKKRYDRTRWFALNFEKLQELESVTTDYVDAAVFQNDTGHDTGDDTRVFQNDTRTMQNDTRSMQNETTIPDTTTEITTETTPDKTIVSSGKRDSIPYDDIVSAYNEICVSLPTVKVLSDKRRDKIRSCYKKVGSTDQFIEVFEKAEASDFLSGRNGVWGGCNFDWLINYNNFIKVLEGTYNNKGGKHGGKDRRHTEEGLGQYADIGIKI